MKKSSVVTAACATLPVVTIWAVFIAGHFFSLDLLDWYGPPLIVTALLMFMASLWPFAARLIRG